MSTFIYIQSVIKRRRYDRPKTHAFLCCRCYNLIQCSIAYTPCRIVYNPLQSLTVMRIYRQTEICNNVLYLLSLIEGQTSIYPVCYSTLTKSLFKDSTLRISSVQNGKIAVWLSVLYVHGSNLVCYNLAFLHVTVSTCHRDRFPNRIFRKDLLPYLLTVLLYQAVCRLHNQLCRTIVLFEFEQTGIIIKSCEFKDIVDISTTERVDTLCVITHHTDTLILACELKNYAVLCEVSVLILIHQNIPEPFGIFIANIRIIFKQKIRIYQQVIEIHRVTLLASFAIPYIYIPHGRNFCL